MSEAALVERSMDSVSVHKERLKRRSMMEEVCPSYTLSGSFKAFLKAY